MPEKLPSRDRIGGGLLWHGLTPFGCEYDTAVTLKSATVGQVTSACFAIVDAEARLFREEPSDRPPRSLGHLLTVASPV